MAFTLGQKVNKALTGGGTTTQAYGSNVTAGNLLVAFSANFVANATITADLTSSGTATVSAWQKALASPYAGAAFAYPMQAYWALVTGTGSCTTSISWNSTANGGDLFQAEFSGSSINPLLVQDGAGQTSTGTTASIVLPSLTTSYTDDLILGFVQTVSSVQTVVSPWSLGATDTQNVWFYQADLAAGTYTPHVTLTSAVYESIMFALGTPAAAAFPVFLPRQLGPRAVGPTFFAALQSPQANQPVFTDAVAGAIIFGGSPAEGWTLQTPSVNQYLPFSLGPAVPLFFARFPPSPSPAAAVGSSLFTDTVAGAIIFGGVPGEAKVGSDVRSGAIIFGGTPGDAKTVADATTGSIIFGGLAGEQYTLSRPFVNQYLPFSLGPASGPLFFARFPPPPSPAAGLSFSYTDTPSGALIFGGAPGEAKKGTDSPTGILIFGGAANDQTTHADVRSGAIIFGGTVVPVTIYGDVRTGTIIFGGSVVAGPIILFLDLPSGTIIFQGTVTDLFSPPIYPVQRFYNAANRNFW
jgi:hypothetical protein